MMQIPDAAVQAAAEKDAEIAGRTFSGFSKYEKQRFLDRAKHMLTAALPHLTIGYEVKKLDWVKGDVDENYHFANTSIQNYIITIFPEENLNIRLLGTSQHGDWYNNIDEAKAAAQADFERRVRECIEGGVDVAAIREALDGISVYGHDTLSGPIKGIPDAHWYRVAVKEMAERADTAIRALSAEPAQGEQWQPIETARPLDEWHEDYGDVVWWAWDENKKEWLGEAPFISHPLSSDWPDYHTHWTPLPKRPAAPTTEAGR